MQSGVTPFIANYTVHQEDWPKIQALMGQETTLEIVDQRGQKDEIKKLTPLYETPSRGPKTRSFAVADLRWRWSYEIISRSYNLVKKSGDRSLLGDVPVETQVTVDRYEHRAFSLQQGEQVWSAREAVKDVLKQLVGEGNFLIESWPISEANRSGTSAGALSIQGVRLDDKASNALQRLLGYIPGAEVYIDKDGLVRVRDATDIQASESLFRRLVPTWDGDHSVLVDRSHIRPSKYRIYYQRELECAWEYEDNLSGSTQTRPGRDTPFIENVIPTVDTKTTVFEYDPETDTVVEKKDLPPGTYVNLLAWLAAMDKIRPNGSLPWSFETIKRHWHAGDLDGVLGGRGLDLDPEGQVSMRIQALKQHFRQTFRISRRYMDRIIDIDSVRVAVLDPVTGARAPAAVWGQACVVPSTKGQRMASRKNSGRSGVYRNVDYLPKEGQGLVEAPPGPTRVSFVDRELGVFRLEWILPPAGTVESFVPCHLVAENAQGTPTVPKRDLSLQDEEPVAGANTKIQGGTNGIFLRPTLEYKVMVTIVPAGPNNKARYHVEEVDAADLSEVFRTEFGISSGKGPEMEVFVPPGEATARFGWQEDDEARQSIQDVLGFNAEDPTQGGLPAGQQEIPGFFIANRKRELYGHSRAVAAEMAIAFADARQGRVAGISTPEWSFLKGNLGGATINVAPAPSGKVMVVHEFPGFQRPVSRFSLLPDGARELMLGILPRGKGN